MEETFDFEKYQKRLERQIAARKQAEELLEAKSLELFQANQNLLKLNNELEQRVQERTEALLDALAHAKVATEAKSLFLSTISHELKTPLTGILGLQELLLETELNEEQKEYVEVLGESAKNLNAIVDDILDFSKLDTKGITGEVSSFSFKEFLENVVEEYKNISQEKGLFLEYDIEAEDHEEIITNPKYLRKVLNQLIGNGIKFTDSGYVRIKGRVREDLLEITVTDTGCGIDPSCRDDIFKPFSQINGSITRKHQGTGMGLATAAKLLELLGGSLFLEKSALGEGSTFKVNLPIEVVQEEMLCKP